MKFDKDKGLTMAQVRKWAGLNNWAQVYCQNISRSCLKCEKLFIAHFKGTFVCKQCKVTESLGFETSQRRSHAKELKE